jgi:GNAT superfamily N-acetyltransferase
VLDQYQGQGIGAALMRHIARLALDASSHALRSQRGTRRTKAIDIQLGGKPVSMLASIIFGQQNRRRSRIETGVEWNGSNRELCLSRIQAQAYRFNPRRGVALVSDKSIFTPMNGKFFWKV